MKSPFQRYLSFCGFWKREGISIWKLNLNQENSKLCTLESKALQLVSLGGEEDDARDKVDALKPKRRLVDINESVDDSDGESEMDELTRFLNFKICK